MMKQKFMYLLCLLMFAVGINAQVADNFGSDVPVDQKWDGRKAATVTVTNDYDAGSNIATITLKTTANGMNKSSTATGAVFAQVETQNLRNVKVYINDKPVTVFNNRIYRLETGTGSPNDSFTIRVEGEVIDKTIAATADIIGATTSKGTSKDGITEIKFPNSFAMVWYNVAGKTSITNGGSTRVEVDTTKPTISPNNIIVYRGETYNTTITATDDKEMKSIVANNAPEGGTFTPSVNGATGTLTLSGTVSLNKERVTQGLATHINDERTSTHTITATDNANNTASATFNVTIRTQTQTYTASEKAGITKTFNLNTTAPTAESLVSIVKDPTTSTLPLTARNVTYSYITPPKMDQVGTQTVRVRVKYEDDSYDDVNVAITIVNPICTKPANTTGTALNTIVGITDLGRANKGNANNSTEWPMMRKGGWLALESNNKGFVVTRMTTTQITAISTPQEGMMVYDTTAKCLKLYDGTKWSCFTKPVCPKF